MRLLTYKIKGRISVIKKSGDLRRSSENFLKVIADFPKSLEVRSGYLLQSSENLGIAYGNLRVPLNHRMSSGNLRNLQSNSALDKNSDWSKLIRIYKLALYVIYKLGSLSNLKVVNGKSKSMGWTVPPFVTKHIFCASRNALITLDARQGNLARSK